MRDRALPRLVLAILLLLALPFGGIVAALSKTGLVKVPVPSDAVAIDTVNGRAGDIEVQAGQPLTVRGSSGAAASETVVADAGDSAFVRSGTTARLVGSAAGGAAPYTFAWSAPTGRLSDADGPAVTFDASGVAPGVVDVTLTATDNAGRSASDTVKVAVYELSSRTVLTASGETAVGVPDEAGTVFGFEKAGGNVDGQSREHRFSVPPGSRDLTVTLDWTQAVNDFDLLVWGEGMTGDTSAASGAKPETLTDETPSGSYVAKVDPFLTVPDTYTLTATVVAPPDDPRPSLIVADPYRFEVGRRQALHADVSGGSGPTKVSWDLDGNGTYEAVGADVVTDFPLGTHLVTAKVVDAAGFESRETVPVRIVAPGSQLGASPFVVIAINDTGINPYHRDYSAETYPDRGVLEATANFTRHPSEYLPGYPSDAEALPVTLGETFLPEADCPDIVENPTTGDDVSGYTINATCEGEGGLWNPSRIEGGKLYWIPGTKIIGAVSSSPDAHPILDDNGHGTGASSVSAGNTYGSCPACLIVFDEGFGSDWAADQEWIDFVSNSYGNINLAPDTPVNVISNIVDVKHAVERGQTWLFASGNGHGNSFVVPNTTYTQKHNGPDWILRVGAVDSGNRQPIIGDGMPADVSSFGAGPLPSASHVSASDATSFSGTSAATPVTSGVFGLVLSAARDALGDFRVGQRATSAVAAGQPVSGSPYLADGTLSRAELWELVLKTAQPGGYPETDVSAFTATYPLEQLHYLFEGYGVADEASAARAVDVMLGGSELPARAEADDFFARDSALRVALYGSWTGFDEAYGADAAATFAGVERDDVATLDAALRVLDPDHTLRGASTDAPATSSVANDGSDATGRLPLLVSPMDGATYDATVLDAVPAAGNVGTRAGTQTLRRYARQGPGTADDACAGEQYLSADTGSGDDPECTFPGQNVTYAGSGFGNFESSFALEDSLPIVLDAHRPVTGTINLDGQSVSPETILLVGLRTGGAIIGWQRVSGAFVGEGPVAFDVSFPVRPRFAGVPLDRLELVVGLRRSNGLAYISLTEPPSFVDLPLAPADQRTVAFSIDGADPTVVAVDERDGSWGSNIDLNLLSTGRHTISATELLAGAPGATQAASFDVVRPPAARIVEVALLGADGAPLGGWTAGRFDRAGVRWRALLTQTPTAPGAYRLVARIRQGSTELARSQPVTVRVR